MKKLVYVFLFHLMVASLVAQEVVLPEDLRQHNLTQYNSSLLNPTFSLDRNNPPSVSLWNRWQWQTIDGNPTSIFLSYTGRLDSISAFNVGFLQHNTGTFLNTGGILNYAHNVIAKDDFNLIFAVNLVGFRQELADDRFVTDNELGLPELEETNQFLLLLNPGVRLKINNFGLALTLENGINLILPENAAPDSDKNFVGSISNDFPVTLFPNLDNTFLRPSVYVKTISNGDTQFGLNALLSTSKFWLQGGYNSFYGPSLGIGGTFARNISIGGLLELPTEPDLSDESSTFELLLSYHFGKIKKKGKRVKEEAQEPEEVVKTEEPGKVVETEEAEKAVEVAKTPEKAVVEEQRETRRERLIRQQHEKDSLERIATARRNAVVRDSINRVRIATEQKRVQDSINQAKKAQEASLLAEQKLKDSIAARQQDEVEVSLNEKYEEAKTADGIQPGFYLIANVFGTKKYYESFMKTLGDKGLKPQSFYRKLNGYNYVYLGRYDTIEEARRARDSKFGGKYPDKTWIFRVRGN